MATVSSPVNLTIAALVSSGVAYGLYQLTQPSGGARDLPLPPGPKSSWFGSADLPTTYQWETYAKWAAEKYGASCLHPPQFAM